MEILHNIEEKKAWIVKEGYTAYVEYELKDGALNILHTVVPEPLGGQGIASQLVESVYNYALENGLKPAATCTYAMAWLQKHPQYKK